MIAEDLGGSELAARLARAEPPAGAGVVAASVVALAAGLCESLARAAAETWPEAAGIAVQAAHLRLRSSAAMAANARTYAAARDRLRPVGEAAATGRDAMLRAALIDAAETLLAISAAAADCAALAAEIASAITPDLEPDAVGAAEMAAGAAASAARLVDANLALAPGDARREQAHALLAAARESSVRARERGDGAR